MNAKWKRNLQYIPVFCVLVLVGLIILIPVIWMTLCAFKPQNQIIAFPPHFFPESLTLQNFTAVLQRIKLDKYVINTVIYALGTTIPSVFLNALAGYAFARLEFKGKMCCLS